VFIRLGILSRRLIRPLSSLNFEMARLMQSTPSTIFEFKNVGTDLVYRSLQRQFGGYL
jgi:hypothetical protein